MAHPGYGYAQGPPVQDPRNPFTQGYPQARREDDVDSEIGDPYGSTTRLAGGNGFYDGERLLNRAVRLRGIAYSTFPPRSRLWFRGWSSQLCYVHSVPLKFTSHLELRRTSGL